MTLRRVVFVAGMLAAAPVLADTATVAVATNFYSSAQTLVSAFERQSPHDILLAPGSTGKLYAQIINGAPFDMFLAADALRPQLLVEQGKTVANSRKTYALGRLALVASKDFDLSDPKTVLAPERGLRLAVADKALAPYGLAAQDVLEYLGLATGRDGELVVGENIGQTYSFVATGNADLGLVALAQVPLGGVENWVAIPDTWHAPIVQDMVLLVGAGSGDGGPLAAQAFHAFLQTPAARAIIAAAGYAGDH